MMSEPGFGKLSMQQERKDEDEAASRGGGQTHQLNSLERERKRRQELNDRLCTLRAMVPQVPTRDRASILRDAIEFVGELKKEVRDLQNELKEPLDENSNKNNNGDKQAVSSGTQQFRCFRMGEENKSQLETTKSATSTSTSEEV